MSKHAIYSTEACREVQQTWRERKHAEAIERSPWIKEAVNAYRALTPEQLAELEAKVKEKRGW